MIRSETHLQVQRIPLEQIKVGEYLKQDVNKVLAYVRLLEEHPGHDMEPIMVRPTPGGYQISNGHKRFCASIIAGRCDILALVLR